MPYGVRSRVRVNNGFVRRGANVWLQEITGNPHAEQVKVIGLSTSRRMVTFWTDPADLENFELAWYVADEHTRLNFATKAEALAASRTLNARARTLPGLRVAANDWEPDVA